MTVGDVMNVNATRIRSNATMQQAVEVVAASQASDLMVVDAENNFVGVLSEGDLIRAAMPRYEEILRDGGSVEDAVDVFVAKGRDLAAQPIDKLVIKSPLTVKPEDPVLKAAGTMINKQIRRLPVVAQGKLVGTISRGDICRAVLAG